MPFLDSFATSNTGSAASLSLSWTHTPSDILGGSYGFVLVGVRGVFTNLTVSWGSAAMTLLGTQTDGSNGVQVKLFGIVQPLDNAQTISVQSTDATPRLFVGGSVLFYRVAQTFGGLNGTGSTNGTSVQIKVGDSIDNGFIVGGIAITGTSTGLAADAGQTTIYTDKTTNGVADNNAYSGFLMMPGQTHGQARPQFNWTSSNRNAMIVTSIQDGVTVPIVIFTQQA